MSTSESLPEAPATGLSRFRLAAILTMLVVGLVVLVAIGVGPRREAKKEQEENRTVLGDSQPEVVTISPAAEKPEHTLTLPGGLEALQEIKVNARVDGYIGRWMVDIGDSVRTGQSLAIIEAPDLTERRAEAEAAVAEAQAEVAQAQSDVNRIASDRARLVAEEEQAKAEVGGNRADIQARQSDAEFARVSNERWQKLVKDQAISLQEADQRATTYQAARATVMSAREKLMAAQSRVKAARARQYALNAEIETGQARVHSAQAKVVARQTAVSRIDSELQFCRVTAPFSGIITQRLIDVGSLVTAGGDKTTLFVLAQSKRLRVFVDVPETDSPLIRIGQKAQLAFKEFPSRTFDAVITRTSESLDKTTRTLRTQIELQNPGPLHPGMHTDVKLTLKGNNGGVVVPSTAIQVRPDGPRVLIVDGQNHIKVTPVTLGMDYGREVQIVSGLTMQDKIVNFPPDGLLDGSPVRPTAAASK